MNPDVSRLLRLEGLVALAVGIVAYAQLDASWWLFALLFLVPDISMIGYLKDARLGAALYNAGHTYVAPALLGTLAFWSGGTLALRVAIIWVCHIGFDRLLGFGLKYRSGFGDTHLEPVSSARTIDNL